MTNDFCFLTHFSHHHAPHDMHQTIVSHGVNVLEQNSLKIQETRKKLASLLKLMKQYTLRDFFKHCVPSETTYACNNVCKRTCLIRKFYFNSSNNETSKNDSVPAFNRTRRATIELIIINGVKYVTRICDCCYSNSECHSCRHVQCALDLLPKSEVFTQNARSRAFISCFKMKNTLELQRTMMSYFHRAQS